MPCSPGTPDRPRACAGSSSTSSSATSTSAGDQTIDATVGVARAEELYDRVFLEYGDDSVAQLGGVHLACEQASNLLTKILEWGRLMAYLEQSTRYIAYDARLTNGRYRYFRDPEILESPLGARYVGDMDRHVRHLRDLLPVLQAWFTPPVPPAAGRLRLRLPPLRAGQGVRRPARPAAGRGHLQRRHLRHRPGVRGAARAHAGPSPPRGPDLRRPDAGRAAQGHPVVPEARRRARPGRRRRRPTSRRTDRAMQDLADGLFGRPDGGADSDAGTGRRPRGDPARLGSRR